MKSTKRSSLQHPDPVKRLAADGVVVPALEPDAVSDGTAGDVADVDFKCAAGVHDCADAHVRGCVI